MLFFFFELLERERKKLNIWNARWVVGRWILLFLFCGHNLQRGTRHALFFFHISYLSGVIISCWIQPAPSGFPVISFFFSFLSSLFYPSSFFPSYKSYLYVVFLLGMVYFWNVLIFFSFKLIFLCFFYCFNV
jgi:hypothetical protein